MARSAENRGALTHFEGTPTMHHITPARAYRLGLRVMSVSGPLALFMLVSWACRWHVLGTRPQLALMLYMALLLVAVGGGCIAMLAACHLAITKAFRAGFQTGAAAATVDDDAGAPGQATRRDGGTDSLLHVVR